LFVVTHYDAPALDAAKWRLRVQNNAIWIRTIRV